MAGALLKMGTADFVAQQRDDVTVLEMRDDLCLDMMPTTKGAFIEMMAASGVKPHVNDTVKSIESGVGVDSAIASWSGAADGGGNAGQGYAAHFTDADGAEHTLPAATVIRRLTTAPITRWRRRLADTPATCRLWAAPSRRATPWWLRARATRRASQSSSSGV